MPSVLFPDNVILDINTAAFAKQESSDVLEPASKNHKRKRSPSSSADRSARMVRNSSADITLSRSTSGLISEYITLWQHQLVFCTSGRGIDLSAFTEVHAEDVFAIRRKDGTIAISLALDYPATEPFLVLSSKVGSARLQAYLSSLVKLTMPKFSRRMSAVYEHTTCLTQVKILQDRIILTLEAMVSPLLQWSKASRALARDATFRFLVDEQYTDDVSGAASVSEFYKTLRPPPPVLPSALPLSGLRTNLLQYQRNAVSWMIDREHGVGEQPNLWTSYTDQEGLIVFMQKELSLVALPEHLFGGTSAPILGGLLSDEMGLGKTLEVLATVLCHTRPQFSMDIKTDLFTGNRVHAVATTLVVAPELIVQQWLDEIQKHTDLTAYRYLGLSHEPGIDLGSYDIVVTSYNILAAEIHHAAPVKSHRVLRQPPLFSKRTCPLIELEWWRIIMDEAQMIQSGSSSAAQVAALIPRVLAWIVTGTPISDSCTDLYGLLHFLRMDPIYNNPGLWNQLLTPDSGANTVANFFEVISCRNTKALVAKEMELPKQTKYLCEVELSAIEEQHIKDLTSTLLETLGLSAEGHPIHGTWADINLTRLQDQLTRLRQQCSVPRVGPREWPFSLNGDGFLQSLDDVLEEMIRSARSLLESDRRSLYDFCLRKGQIFEYRNEPEAALQVWLDLLPELEDAVTRHEGLLSIAPTDEHSAMNDTRRSTATASLRHSKEILHRCYFFLGSVYFQLGQPIKETEFYAKAKDTRKSLLTDAEDTTMCEIDTLRATAQSQDFVTVPEIKYAQWTGGIMTNVVLASLQSLTETLNEQANLLDDFREQCVQNLIKDLADQNDDPSGEEYQQSLDAQEEAYAYLELVTIMTNDRLILIEGQGNPTIESDSRRYTQLSGDAVGASKIIFTGMQLREQLPATSRSDSLKSVLAALNDFLHRNSTQVSGPGGRRPANKSLALDLEIARSVHKDLKQVYATQSESISALLKEVKHLDSVYNARLEYYRQFQAISDTVQGFTVLRKANVLSVSEKVDAALGRATGKETQLEVEESDISEEERSDRIHLAIQNTEDLISRMTQRIRRGTNRLRYLEYLGNPEKQTEPCIICTSDIVKGILTACGHIFCAECARLWFKHQVKCPTCKTPLKGSESFTQITVKAKGSALNDIEVLKPGVDADGHDISEDFASEYAYLDEQTKARIRSSRLSRSYSSKVDAMLKHLIALDPGSKSIIYSSWPDMLRVLHLALQENGISAELWSTPRGRHAIKSSRFAKDPDCGILLLSGESQAAGLTLVNATNLFLMEPILSPAVEQQVLSRIHRIGQTKPTSVFQYAVRGTLELTILRQSMRKRSGTSSITEHAERHAEESTPSLPPTRAETTATLDQAAELIRSAAMILQTSGDGDGAAS